MNLENDQWNIADEEFSLWLNGNKQDKNLDLTDILKSTFFAFREKKRSWLEELCNQSLKYLKEKNFRPANDFLSEPNIRFSKRALSESEQIHQDKLKKEEDERIIKGILSGNQQVFKRLYEYEFPKIVRLIISNSGDLISAEDVFQDALMVFIEKVYRKELDLTCSVSTYLYSICRYLWLDKMRKDKKNISFYDSYSHWESDIRFIIDETTPDIFDNVSKVIETLGDPCKQLLEHYYYKNQSWDEIANSLGYANAASARNQKYKCLERIKKLVSVEAK